MPSKRRRVTRNAASRLTPEAIEAFEAQDAMALHRALRLPPWQVSPLDAIGDCPWANNAGAATWAESVRLREALASVANSSSIG